MSTTMKSDRHDDLFEELFAKAVRKSCKDELDKLDAMMESGKFPKHVFSERHNENMRKLFEMDRSRGKS